MNFKAEAFRKDIILCRSLTNRLGMRDCASQIGISASTLSRLETGKIPDIHTFIKVCTWLKKDIKNYIK